MTITYHQARKQALLELMDEGISAREIANAAPNSESNVYDLIDAVTERIFNEHKAEEKQAE